MMETNQEETIKDGSKPPKKSNLISNIMWGTAVLLVLSSFFYVGYSSQPSSSSSSIPSNSSGTHKCVWCGKTYTGPGYYHVVDNCESADHDYDQCCSEKCCMDQWNALHK